MEVKLNKEQKEGILDYLEFVGVLKHLKRTGWVRNDISECETVSGHMYRMAMFTFLIDGDSIKNLNRSKCLEMALIHDLAESIVGDITPDDGITAHEKHALELDAMVEVTRCLPTEVGDKLLGLYIEYESQTSAEAKFVKEIDLFDFAHQSYEYEKSTGRDFTKFYRTVTQERLSTPLLRDLKLILDERRKKLPQFQPTDQ